ncbi:MAG: 2-hydroxyglutaryl-CoA dehydratase [Desulfobacterales bacterium]|nr:2-hydroxyglutaryl-CoA dehydratase [Deltaproteobacteria bacterium]NNL42913.1 2-hydroxyglutaryl-CoA dehydratase [Desulfobacterales bacterium]NNL74876.1 2-hydroxyglutaryl-CoA dehydratase [Desulfobacterales bacterium]
MITVGIDIGSITTKAAILKNGNLILQQIIPTGYNAEKAALNIFNQILSDMNFDQGQIHAVVTTGYGRKSAPFADRTVTEIMCHAAGAHFMDPRVRSIIDIGGQDSKAIVIDENGSVKDFAMNDKCAAGTGRFLEVMARAMEINLNDFGEFSLQAENPSKISSLCTVFAESEVISLISAGEKRENIIAGIHQSISSRVMAMAGRIGITAPIMMTGGVAKNIGVVRAIEKKSGKKIEISQKAQVAGAIGAAIVATKEK